MNKKLFSIIALSLLIFTACKSATPAEEASLVDKQIYEDAINSMNPTLCGTIVDAALKADCRVVIESNKLSEEAITNSDLAKCNKIEHSQIRESCKIQVEKNNSEKEQKEKELARQEDDQSKMQSIQDDLDLEACDQLQTPHLKKECILNVSTALAEKNQEPSYCRPIEDEDLRARCEQNSK